MVFGDTPRRSANHVLGRSIDFLHAMISAPVGLDCVILLCRNQFMDKRSRVFVRITAGNRLPLGGESLPLGLTPSSCSPTPSSGDTPQRPDSSRFAVEMGSRLSPAPHQRGARLILLSLRPPSSSSSQKPKPSTTPPGTGFAIPLIGSYTVSGGTASPTTSRHPTARSRGNPETVHSRCLLGGQEESETGRGLRLRLPPYHHHLGAAPPPDTVRFQGTCPPWRVR